MKLFDTHSHIADRAYDGDRAEVLERAWAAGLVGMISVGFDLPSSRGALRLAQADDRIWAAVGVHPHEAEKAGPGFVDELRRLARFGELGEAGPGGQRSKVVAIGEAGLDFYRDLSPRPVQRDVFRRQVELALELGLPLIVHDRDAHDETLDILREYYGDSPARATGGRAAGVGQAAGTGRAAGVLHCFSGDRAMGWDAVALGFYVSFAGPLTYPNALATRDAAKALPLDRILVETDCPYLAPQSRRGKRNEPALVAEVAKALAAARGLGPDVASHQTTLNARRLFGLR